MGCFERPQRPQTLPEIPERLIRLDRELTTRVKDFDTIFAVRGDQRFKVTIFRYCGRFIATVRVGRRSKRGDGDLPSHAYARVIRSLNEELIRIQFEQNFKDQAVKPVSQTA